MAKTTWLPTQKPVGTLPRPTVRLLPRGVFGCALLSENGRIISASRSLAQMVGSPLSLLIGHSIFKFLIPTSTWKKNQSLIDGNTNAVLCGRRLVHLTVHKIAAGMPFGNCYVGLVSNEVEDCEQMSLTKSPETKKRHFEAELAHELIGPLSAIASTVELMLVNDDVTEDSRDALQLVHEEAFRLGDLLRGFLSTAGNRHSRITGNQVVHLIQRCIAFSHAELTKRAVECQVTVDSSLPSITGDEVGLTQVLMNLIKNAFNAMPAEGHLHISVKRGELREKAALEIRIIDQGSGISPQDLQRVFEPFFTSKPNGNGTGLGLAISRRIVLEHQGQLTLSSHSGRGTTATVLLPALPTTRKAATTSVSNHIRTSRERMLKQRKVQGRGNY